MKYLIIFLFAGILVSCNQNNSNSENKRFKTIMLKTEGVVETVPNMASFNIYLQCTNLNIKESKRCLIDKSNSLIELLTKYGIAKNDILTTAINLDKRYVWKNNSSVFSGYEASTSLAVTIKNLDNLDIVYTDLIDDPNLSLSSLSYSHSKLDSLKNEAYLIALENANTTADRLLSKLPENKKEVLKIGNVAISASLPENDFMKYESKAEMELYEDNANQNISISKGTVYVIAELYVEFLIK